MKSKKGVEMSIQTMVVAVLALAVLIVLVVLMMQSSGNFGKSVNACDDKGPAYNCRDGCGSNEKFYSASGCGDNEVCCVQEEDFKDSLGLG